MQPAAGVRTLAERLFAGEKPLVRIDMSEYREPHTVARLIGSPHGYVGYGTASLTEPERRRPYSVVLLDEIEKARRGAGTSSCSCWTTVG